MSQSKMSQKQKSLAMVAQKNPEHAFTHLYPLMHWEYWVQCAAEAVLARPGSSMAGIDGTTRDEFRKNYEQGILSLVESLKKKSYQPQPVRRVDISKANGKKRPLGIAVLRDRIVQEALRAILDPIYETDFQSHSFGFRQGRSSMDAVAVIMSLTGSTQKYYYVIEGQLKSGFEIVHQRQLLSILKQRVADKDLLDLIWKFLKAGVMEDEPFSRTETGLHQGGAISPFLTNVYLNELDKWAETKWNVSANEKRNRRYAGQGSYQLIRYANDFVVLSNDAIAGVQCAKQAILEFLKTELYLDLSAEKMLLTHLNDGFDFLGFRIQRYKPEGRWVVHLRPAERSKERVKRELKDLTSRNWTWMDEYSRLSTLNTIVKEWAEYYQFTSLRADIEEITRHTWFRYLGWLLKKHKGSQKDHLIATKTQMIHNRRRWTASMREGEKVLETYQWLPTRNELPRRRYYPKGKGGFPHPYLMEAESTLQDFPLSGIGPDEPSPGDLPGNPQNLPL